MHRVSELSRKFLDPEASFDPAYLAACQTTVDYVPAHPYNDRYRALFLHVFRTRAIRKKNKFSNELQ